MSILRPPHRQRRHLRHLPEDPACFRWNLRSTGISLSGKCSIAALQILRFPGSFRADGPTSCARAHACRAAGHHYPDAATSLPPERTRIQPSLRNRPHCRETASHSARDTYLLAHAPDPATSRAGGERTPAQHERGFRLQPEPCRETHRASGRCHDHRRQPRRTGTHGEGCRCRARGLLGHCSDAAGINLHRFRAHVAA